MATLSTANIDSDAAKGNNNCNRNPHGILWIIPILVLLLQWILEAILLGSFHWVSNEEILTLSLMVSGFYTDSNCTL
jgi:hypothetical protein